MQQSPSPIEDDILLILIVRIGDRKEIYEIIRRL
jgi:hypothetical protein